MAEIPQLMVLLRGNFAVSGSDSAFDFIVERNATRGSLLLFCTVEVERERERVEDGEGLIELKEKYLIFLDKSHKREIITPLILPIIGGTRLINGRSRRGKTEEAAATAVAAP